MIVYIIGILWPRQEQIKYYVFTRHKLIGIKET